MASALLAEGELLDGKYRIIGSLGRGAWGHVYEGVNERIGRPVAIKVMHSELAAKTDMRDRFEREARAATRIESVHVVHIFDMGFVPDGRPYIVMERLKGEDLAKRIERDGALQVDKVAILGVQALRGLGEAHAAGILHRDIKPDNIVLVRSKHQGESVKIVDFGISKLVAREHEKTSQTATTQVLGSPVYMSPEQCRGARNMDHRSDLYSLGVTLFEAVTGHLPFDAETFNELMFKIALEDAPDARSIAPELDASFAAVLTKALARDPDKRYQNAEEFETALVEWGETRGLTSEDWRRLSASVTRRKAGPSPMDVFARTMDLAKSPLHESGSLRTSENLATDPDVKTPERLRTSGAGSSLGPAMSVTGAHLPKAKSRLGVVVAACLVVFVLLGGGVLALRSRAGSLDARASAAVSPTGEVVVPSPKETATVVAVPAPVAAVGGVAEAGAAEVATPEGKPGASRVARPDRHSSRGSRGTVVVTRPSASAAPAAPSAAKPGTVIDGRTIQTEF